MKSKKPFVGLMVAGIVIAAVFAIVAMIGGFAGIGTAIGVAEDPGDADLVAVNNAFKIVKIVGFSGLGIGAVMIVLGIVFQVKVGKDNAKLAAQQPEEPKE